MSTPTISLQLALLSAGLLGLRHGFDYDHVAAISDIAATQPSPGRAMRMGMLYAVGHALVVGVLGISAIALQRSLPARLDPWMEMAVGCTLLTLGVYVLWTAVFQSPAHPHVMRTRMMLLADAILWCVWRIRRAFSSRPQPRTRVLSGGIGSAPALFVGAIHGLGAETPTQVLLFLLAANLGGIGKGMLGLAMFILGLLCMNAAICAVATGVLQLGARKPIRYRFLAGLSAVYSMVVGAYFVTAPFWR